MRRLGASAVALTAAVLLAPALRAATADGMRAALERITKGSSNEERFDAVTSLLREQGTPFTVEPFSIEKPLRGEPRTDGRNIVATFGTSAEGIVFGAHYDATRLADGALSHGAVDNAASSVVLIELAKALRSQPPAKRVTLVWFDMEELGLIGSTKYVEAHSGDRDAATTAMINLDVNGYGDTVLFGASRGEENALVRKAVLETCAATDASCVGFPQMPPGDDRSFVKAGVPSVSLATIPALEAHQLWLLLNSPPAAGTPPRDPPAVLRIIHTPTDVIEKVDPAAMVRMADFTLDLVRRLTR